MLLYWAAISSEENRYLLVISMSIFAASFLHFHMYFTFLGCCRYKHDKNSEITDIV